MLELSLHILDIAENSVRADATVIEIAIGEDTVDDTLTIEIKDNGKGMNRDSANRALDPFFTTRRVRRVGLGLPLFEQATEAAGGHLEVETEEGRGTRVLARFVHSHIDRQPLGRMADTMATLIAGNAGTDFLYRHRKDGREFTLDTREMKKELGGIPLNNSRVLQFITRYTTEGLKEIGVDQ